RSARATGAGGRELSGHGRRYTRLCREEWLQESRAWTQRWYRFRLDRVYRGRCLGKRECRWSVDAVGIFITRKHRRFRAAWEKSWNGIADDSHHRCFSRIQSGAQTRLQRREAGCYRGKSAGENSRHVLDVPIEQVWMARIK